jgi:hypothetical protein
MSPLWVCPAPSRSFPLLAELAGKAPSLYVALMTMSIVTVSPDYPFLAFGVNAVQACMKRFPDDTRLWLDYELGKQFCAWIESILENGGPLLLDEADMRVHVEEINFGSHSAGRA